jgi:hypothetical protein
MKNQQNLSNQPIQNPPNRLLQNPPKRMKRKACGQTKQSARRQRLNFKKDWPRYASFLVNVLFLILFSLFLLNLYIN